MPGKSLESALAEPPSRGAEVCHVVTQTESLKLKKDRAALYAAVDNPAWSGRQLSNVLVNYGLTVSTSAINSHRRGDCPCYKGADRG